MVGIVQIRYAEALYKLASEYNKVDLINDEVKSIKKIIETQEDFIKILSHPQITEECKIDIVKNVFENKVSDELIGLMILIIKKERENILLKVYDEFLTIVKTKKNISTAIVTSAIDLSDEYIDKIKSKLKTCLNKEIEIEARVDNEIIGGLKIQVDNTIFDRTLKTRIDSMSRTLCEVSGC